jgi:drug/metabolite transporter (DMT)-like permease
VTAWLWLAAAAAAAVGAYLVGWPAWTGYRSRAARDLNAERYLAWRGRASRGPASAGDAGLTNEERRRLWIAVALALAAVFCLVGFFTFA